MPLMGKRRRVSTVRLNNPDISKCGDRLIFSNQHLPKLCQGLSFLFNGFIKLNCDKFWVSFSLNKFSTDVALLISPNLLQKWIGRNSKVKSQWQRQDITALIPFPLKRGSDFFMQVLFTEECYMIAFNGHHFAEYKHRIPYTSVACIEVAGEIKNLTVQYAVFPTYPEPLEELKINIIPVIKFLDYQQEPGQTIPQEFRMIPKSTPKSIPKSSKLLLSATSAGLAVPYYGHLLPNSLIAGHCLRIEGRIQMLPHLFSIQLQRGHDIWPHPIVAFCFNPRYSEKVKGKTKNLIMCGAWHSGNWTMEEHPMVLSEFEPGRIFTLLIVSGTHSYDVYVNHKFTTKFTYRVNPDIVDTVSISGDIKLWSVLLANKVRLMHNMEPLQVRRRSSIFRKSGSDKN